MIIDSLAKAEVYKNLNHRIKLALDYLEKTDFSKVESGKYEIDGDSVYALVSEYKSKHASDGKLEAHKKYLDVQYVAEGKELMGFAQFKNQEIIDPYKEENDISFFKGDKTYIKFEKGMFAIFYPQDLHMPGIMVENSEKIKKVVVKVKV